MQRNKGFHVIELLIAIAVIAIIGFVGFRVWQASRKPAAAPSGTSTAEAEPPAVTSAGDLDRANEFADQMNTAGDLDELNKLEQDINSL